MWKPSLQKNSDDIIQLLTKRNKGFLIFPKGISPKVNVILWLVFELAYHNVTIQHVSHYTMGTHTLSLVYIYI